MEREEIKSQIKEKLQLVKEYQTKQTECAKKIKTLLESVNPNSPRRNTAAMQKKLQVLEGSMKNLEKKIKNLYTEMEQLAKNAADR